MRSLLIVVLVFALTGCTEKNILDVKEIKPQDQILVSEYITIDKNAFLAEQTSLDIDGDGEKETVEMYVSPSPVRPNGELSWDDSHLWQLLVKDGDKIYPLYNEQPQFGLIRIWTYSGENPSILLLEDGNGTSIITFEFNKELNSFTKKNIYQSDIIPDHRSRFPEKITEQYLSKQLENKSMQLEEIENINEDQTLYLYFEAMNNKSYNVMSKLYGGTFEVLEGFSFPNETNPETLIGNYCGAVPMVDIKEIVKKTQISDGEYQFEVIHRMKDGSLFTEFSPYAQEIYIYTVKKIDGMFKVIELPPYIS